MNSLLVLTFFGLAASVFAEPSCSDTEANKCNKLAPSGIEYDLNKSWPETAKGLDFLCPGFLKMIQCTIDFSARCPNTLTAAFIDSNREYQRIYSKICSESDPARQKFLETVPCLNKEVGIITKGCEKTITDLGYCELQDAIGKCIKDEVAKKCGKEAYRMFSNLYKPREAQFEVFCRVNSKDM
ncbi:uncharacterized protein LOC129225195 [Uloborus diversus]|uniref:uncharacterized protein LOC129225195 n=1 Tax=Uloborus diversus TaxID=327109 RepID=UPI0024094872|nr:uncharacterized protein LOC129225195 [Uloborus diversus]